MAKNINISNFIKHLSEKNYAEANKYLQATLHEKIKDRINKSVKTPLFKNTK